VGRDLASEEPFRAADYKNVGMDGPTKDETEINAHFGGKAGTELTNATLQLS
jgi:hypothetical protein